MKLQYLVQKMNLRLLTVVLVKKNEVVVTNCDFSSNMKSHLLTTPLVKNEAIVTNYDFNNGFFFYFKMRVSLLRGIPTCLGGGQIEYKFQEHTKMKLFF